VNSSPRVYETEAAVGLVERLAAERARTRLRTTGTDELARWDSAGPSRPARRGRGTHRVPRVGPRVGVTGSEYVIDAGRSDGLNRSLPDRTLRRFHARLRISFVRRPATAPSWKAYTPKAAASMAGHAMKSRAYGRQEVLEGPVVKGLVVEFPRWRRRRPGTTARSTARRGSTGSGGPIPRRPCRSA